MFHQHSYTLCIVHYKLCILHYMVYSVQCVRKVQNVKCIVLCSACREQSRKCMMYNVGCKSEPKMLNKSIVKQVNYILCTTHCSLCTILHILHYALRTIRFTLHIMQHTRYSAHHMRYCRFCTTGIEHCMTHTHHPYTTHYTEYTTHFAPYSRSCKLLHIHYPFHDMLYTIHCTTYIAQCMTHTIYSYKLHSIHNTLRTRHPFYYPLYNMKCILDTLHDTDLPYTVHLILHIINTLYTMHQTRLYTMH